MAQRITCIIPARNCEKTIERAVKSAFDAGCDRVLTFDDASTDDTDPIMDSLYTQYGYENYHAFGLGQSVRAGVNFVRNFLIEEAEDGLIIPLDADDTLCSIAPLFDAWKPHTWVYGNHAEIRNSMESVAFGAPVGGLARKNVTGVTFLFHREDWKAVGGYDPDFAYAEDYGFQCALVHGGIAGTYVNQVVYNRYLHEHGNERTAKATAFWPFYHDLARMKYPSIFQFGH